MHEIFKSVGRIISLQARLGNGIFFTGNELLFY